MQRRMGRIGWIEWARVLGAVGVVVLHVLTSSFAVVPEEISDVRLAGYVVVSVVLGRWAVPGFFMITGYLLLDPSKEVGWAKAWKYAKRMILVLLTFGLAFSLMEEASLCLSSGTQVSFGVVLAAARDVLTASSWDHLWYVYTLVFVYMCMPILKWVYQRLGERGFAALTIGAFVVVLVVPTCVRLWLGLFGAGVDAPPVGADALVDNVLIGVTCLCVGGCLRFWHPKRMLALVLCGVVSVAVMIVVSLVGMLMEEYGDMGFVFLQGSCFACIYAVCALTILRRVIGEEPISLDTMVARLAEDSFGIYVIHPLFVHLVLLKANPLAFPPALFEAAFVFGVFVTSAATTRILQRIPLIGPLL